MTLDPASELFDLCDARGNLLGRTKARALVHRDGDWHRAFHCWVVSPSADDSPVIVLQRRALEKETHAGLWDVSVGGHYAAGEGIEGGLREMQEELGLAVAPQELMQVGRRRVEVFYDDGLVDREIEDVYMLWREISLSGLHPDPVEVMEVALLPPWALDGLARRRLPEYRALGGRVAADGSVDSAPVLLTPQSLVPDGGGYYTRIARLAERLARGETPPRRQRWL
jgi:isopentenyldiphosphate isomerase